MDVAPKERIRNSAMELFAKYGFAGVSTRDIANHASVNISMISYYFDSKDNLLYGLISDAKAGSQQLLPRLNFAVSPKEQLRIFIDFYLEYHRENWQLFAILMQEQTHHNNALTESGIREWKLFYSHTLTNILLRSKPEECRRKCSTDLMATLIMGTLNEYLSQYVAEQIAPKTAGNPIPDTQELHSFMEEITENF